MTLTGTETGADVAAMSDQELFDRYHELTGLITRLQAEEMRVVGEIDARNVVQARGYGSTTQWLKHTTGLASGEATETIRVSRALRHMPATEEAFRDAETGLRRVRQLVRTRNRHQDQFADHEQVLVDSVASVHGDDVGKVLGYWSQAVDAEAALEDEHSRYERRRLHVSTTIDGMTVLDAVLDPESGAIVATAIGALSEPVYRNRKDPRSKAQVRADALIDICKHFLDYADTPIAGGQRPQLTVICDLEVLEGRANRAVELDDHGVITPQAARRLACDAEVTRVITRGESEILDLGRSTRVFTPAQKKAMAIRDGGCVAEGCDRPPRMTDAHHKVPWAHGGRTSVDDGELRCRFHHIIEHNDNRGPPNP